MQGMMIQKGGGSMSEIEKLRQTVRNRQTWLRELEELRAQVRPAEREILRLELKEQLEQEDVTELEGFSVKGLFMSRARKEEQLEKERQEAAAARSALEAARFQLESIHRSIAFREAELRACQGSERELVLLTGDPEALALLERAERLPVLTGAIREKQEALRAILAQSDQFHVYGDIRPTGTGGRFNNAYAAQRGLSRQCIPLTEELENLLEEYRAIVPGTTLPEAPWAEDPGYWAGAQTEDALFDRMVGLENWLRPLEKLLAPDQAEETLWQNLRQHLLQ